MTTQTDVLAIERFMQAERAEGSPCKLTVTLLKDGQFSARLSFAPGMETASATGSTVADALTSLSARLGGAA